MLRYLLLGFALLLGSSPLSEAQTKRRVFVLHSGMHIVLAPKDKNHAARTMKELLNRSGIAERDLVALDCPFPTASWADMVPRDGLLLYLESTDPKSRSSQDAYVRLHKALQVQGVTKNDDLVWIGHSAGGQMGMTMAHLAHNLDKHPDLAKKAEEYRFDMVITLGSAVGSNPVPANVKLRHYYSEADTMIQFLSKHGDIISDALKSKVRFRPSYEGRGNVKIRVFPDIDHAAWYTDDSVLACIRAELDSKHRPVWRRGQPDTALGMGLSQLMAQALEAEMGISLEEDRH